MCYNLCMKRRLKKKYRVFFKRLVLLIIIGLFCFLYFRKRINDNVKLIDVDKIYLAIGEKYELPSDVNVRAGNNLVSLDGNVITGKSVGSSNLVLTKDKVENTVEVIVTDLYTLPHIDNEKDKLKCKEYTSEEAKILDEALEFKIKKAGYGTRAGVVAASRFLTLEFKYRLNYFYENGRLNNYGDINYVDGEGRYYHKGLYLSEDKYKDIKTSMHGPSMWGCPLYVKLFQREEINGLDCSGFISWAMLNGGFDIGDSGAGIDFDRDDDLDDFGIKMKINEKEFDKSKVKVGDLISRYAHIGIIIGIENDIFYVAEALDYDLHVKVYNLSELISSDWLYVQLMDEYYKKDGILTNMWN